MTRKRSTDKGNNSQRDHRANDNDTRGAKQSPLADASLLS
jgi:hypothetical protein